jgi:hypothetical protein
MLRSATTILALLLLSTLTFAQQNKSTHASAASLQPGTGTCAYTFTTGTGHGVTKYCVTANGNIAQFSAMGDSGLPQEMLNGVTAASEGYGVCDTGTLTSYFDYSSSATTNWSAATAVSSANSVTITRTTSDGVWKLVQTITQLPGSRVSYGAAKVQMALTNLSNQTRIIILLRHANVDAVSSTFNDFDTSATTSFGTALGGLGGLMATASFLTTQFDFHFSLVQTNPDAPDPCTAFGNFGGQQGFFEGDGSLLHYFNLEIAPGNTKSATVTYKPI